MTIIKKVELREYFCPVCQNESQHSTNHEGEIYPGCRKCGSSVLYFKGDDREFKPMFNLKKYRFDLSDEEQCLAYRKLESKLFDQGLTKFDSLVIPRQNIEFFNALEDNELLHIHDDECFEHQFISNRGRVHSWFEAIVPNKDTKVGYYLVINQAYL